MDLPLLASPHHLDRLGDRLRAAAAQIGRIAASVEQLGCDESWRGPAQRAFSASARHVGSQCLEISCRLTADAARVEAMADQLRAELAILHHLEHAVVGALGRLATRALHDTSGAAQGLYDSVRHRLPDHGSPLWRDLASHLVHGELA